MTFINRLPISLRIYWLNYDGRRQFYGVVGPRRSYRQQTYVTHPWVLTDRNENCVAVYMPAREPRRVFVTGKRESLPAAARSKIDGEKRAPIAATQTPADKRLVGRWLALHDAVEFSLGCDSGEPVRYSADGSFMGPGIRGTWRLRGGQLTEIIRKVDDESDDTVAIGAPYGSQITWEGPDRFVRSFPDGDRMPFQRCPDAVTPATAPEDEMEQQRCVWRCLANSKGNNDPRYHACVEKMCAAKN